MDLEDGGDACETAFHCIRKLKDQNPELPVGREGWILGSTGMVACA